MTAKKVYWSDSDNECEEDEFVISKDYVESISDNKLSNTGGWIDQGKKIRCLTIKEKTILMLELFQKRHLNQIIGHLRRSVKDCVYLFVYLFNYCCYYRMNCYAI